MHDKQEPNDKQEPDDKPGEVFLIGEPMATNWPNDSGESGEYCYGWSEPMITIEATRKPAG